MNTNPRRQPTKPLPAPAPTGFRDEFAEMPDPLSVVEHVTIAGFIRRCPHRFHINDVIRFGDQSRKIAESLGVSYLTTTDRQLGQVRLYPRPMLERIYANMAASSGWEALNEVRQLEESSAAARADERTCKRLEVAASAIDDPAVAQAMRIVIAHLEGNARRLRGEPEIEAAPAQPLELRPV